MTFDLDQLRPVTLEHLLSDAELQTRIDRKYVLADTQTGLRGYPHRQLDWLADVPGDRFEYELNRWPTSS